MRIILALVLSSLSILSCSVKPEPLVFGKDSCYACKMTLMDEKFGAEIVTKKGKVYKFDDVNCMITFYNSGYEPKENIEHDLVIDFGDPGKLMKAESALYIHSPEIRSPMLSQVAAFSSQVQLDNHNKEWNGKVMTWEEVVEEFN